MQGYLLLADGSLFEGRLFGCGSPVEGELVFNTSMVGYQEILTDPSYHRQIVVLTYPEIGNYGTMPSACESRNGHASGMVIRQMSPAVWHRLSEDDFDAYLNEKKITAIADIDTRLLTRKIRDSGPQNALIAPAELDLSDAKAQIEAMPSMIGANLVPAVSTKTTTRHGGGPVRIVLVDYGIKQRTIDQLARRGCEVFVVPWDSSFEAVSELKPHGVLLSNGPGDPDAVPGVPETVAQLMDAWPVMGICLGYQMMALALGGRTFKLPFGHRGGNHPVKDLQSGAVLITAQNHGFAVDAQSLPGDRVELTHESLFDGSLEGFRLLDRPAFGVQFHPEAAPGPRDAELLFDRFLSLIEGVE